MTHEVNSPVSFELLLTRLIGAPREKLFRAWTDPALIVQCGSLRRRGKPYAPRWTYGLAAAA